MPTIASWLETPSGIVLNRFDPRRDDENDSTSVTVSGSVVTYIKWRSVHYTFQVQWRWRERMSPARAAAAYPAGGEVWTDWGAWQGIDPDSSSIAKTVKTDTSVYMADAVSIPFDLSSADRRELQVRVRAYNEPTDEASEWCTATLSVLCAPVPRYSAMLNPDGSVTLHASTDWQRPNNSLYVTLFNTGVTLYFFHLAADCDVLIPARWVGNLKPGDDFKTNCIEWVSSDGASIKSPYAHTALAATGYSDAAVSKPAVTWSTTDALGLQVRAIGTYDSVFGSITFTDACGKERTYELEFSGGVAVCSNAAIGTDMALRIVAERDGQWRLDTYTCRIDSQSACLSWEDEACVMPYGVSVTDEATYEVETIKVAGSNRPVSRYGTGGERKLTLSEADVSFVSTQAPKRVAEALKAPHDWILRAPGGVWHRVCVTGLSRDYSPYSPVDSVKVSMLEVE